MQRKGGEKGKFAEPHSRKKKIIANTELCVTEAIRTEQNSSSQTTPADSETDPLRWMLHKVSSP